MYINELCGFNRGQYIAYDVAKGLHSLHLRNIIHFDLVGALTLMWKQPVPRQTYLPKLHVFRKCYSTRIRHHL